MRKSYIITVAIALLLLVEGLDRASAQTLTTLWQFGNGPTDGAGPSAGLVQGSDGYFYGTTDSGGTNVYDGVVFRISSAGTLTTLYQFGSSPFDGQAPQAGLVQGSDGNFYGTTYEGGRNDYNPPFEDGDGTVFKITSQGTYTTLWQFGSSPTDGQFPSAGLLQGSDGYFYGTTQAGGTNGAGVVFRISSAGTLTTLYQFGSRPSDGVEPLGALVQGSDGYFYGTTYVGGTNDLGTVFKITSQGTLTTLYQFGSRPSDGVEPLGALVQGSDGYFYGTTSSGGTNDYDPPNYEYGDGTVFKITSQGTLTTLWQFGSSPTDGHDPFAGLVQGSDGYFYGTTRVGGTNGVGVVFQLSVPLNPPANQIAGIEFFSVFDDSGVAIRIPSIAGETYQLQYSDSMNPPYWLNTGDPVSSIGGALTLFDVVGVLPPQRFYRAVITP